MLPYNEDNQKPEPERSHESMDDKRDRERRQRNQRRSWLPTAVFLSLHALLLFLGIVYLVPWIQKKVHKPPTPVAPPPPVEPVKLRRPDHPIKRVPPTPDVPVIVPPKPVEKVVPFPPPDASGEIDKLIALARRGIKGKVLVVRQDGGGYKTIREAVKAAADGDTIEIADSGTYNEVVVIRGKKNILLRAARDAKPIINVEKRQAFCIKTTSAPGVIVRGLACAKARDTAISIGRKCERALVAENLAEQSNFGVRATSANVAILANVCGENRVGIAVEQGAGAVIIDNVTAESEFAGIRIARSPETIILNNIVRACRGAEGIKLSLSDDSMMLHNTVAIAYKSLIRVERSNGVTVKNNIIVRGSNAAISFGPTVKKALCDYNLAHEVGFWGDWQAKRYNVLETWQNATGHDAHSLYAVPAFVDDDADFRLRPSNPAKGKADEGTDLGVDWDKSGLKRLDKILRSRKPAGPKKDKGN